MRRDLILMLTVILAMPIFGGEAVAKRKRSPYPVIALDKETAQIMKKEQRGYWVEIQVPQRRILLAKGDHLIKAFPIAVGEPDYPTPMGFRKINTIIWNPWWYPPPGSKWVEDPTPIPPRTPENPLGEIKMPLGDNYLVHGTRAVDSIGRWASHGCIRMIFEDLFSLVQILMTDYSDISAIEAMEKANRDTNTQFHTSLNRSIPVMLNYNPVIVHDGMVAISPDFYKRVPDMTELVTEKIAPYLKKKQTINPKKIKAALKYLRKETVIVNLLNLVDQEEED